MLFILLTLYMLVNFYWENSIWKVICIENTRIEGCVNTSKLMFLIKKIDFLIKSLFDSIENH